MLLRSGAQDLEPADLNPAVQAGAIDTILTINTIKMMNTIKIVNTIKSFQTKSVEACPEIEGLLDKYY